ncbi:hypothetical protein ABID22_002744 [Pontibacter aydingkolensis]|uniref:Amidohydrolase family protein n=1 Tax=Pontibacter aydingkolensis TaxID=1911536 RepID=A0ABS7CWR1_9BACT|nr:amidohydrolase family protein [Pontibacter aydingkolensis]MBW7468296.1 amidohydrolase family protein [Pontibacter aydingkolensis]
MKKPFLTLTLFFCCLFAHAQNLYVKNVNIVDVKEGTISKHRNILITNGRIASFNPKKRQTRHHAVIDGKDRYVIPGLFEMHAHIGPQNKYFLQDFVKFGITNVRVMAGSEGVLAWRDSIDNLLLTGPSLQVVSPVYDGNPPLWGEAHAGPILTDKHQVRELIAKHKQMGYQEIKVYNRLPEDIYLEILKVASEKGIKVTGHLPYTLSKENFGDPRHNSHEHLDGVIQYATEISPDFESLKEERTRNELYLNYDSLRLAPYAAKLKNNKVWLTPTLSLYANINNKKVKQELKQLRSQQSVQGLLGWWESLPASLQDNFKLKSDVHRQFVQHHFLDYADYILIGTDSPNPYNLPGLAVHHEMEYLADAGFTNAAVLKMATYNAARYANLTQDYGSIEAGKYANLVILEDNPLQDIRNTKKIHQVILKGKPQLE